MNIPLKTQRPSIESLRKVHPRIGMKWEAEEDEKLKAAYERFLLQKEENFEAFLTRLVKDFGRASGGIIARLAANFSNVPGFDYGREEARKKSLEDESSKSFDTEKLQKLYLEYEKYLGDKKETYLNFLSRIADALKVESRFIRFQLEKKFGKLVVYRREDVEIEKIPHHKPWEDDLSSVDFSENPEALQVLDLLNNSSENLFLTGEAGTGKSTLLQYFRKSTKKNVVVLAPTGVAALNVLGQTIHSFCGFGPDITLSQVKKGGTWSPKKKLLQNLDIIIIDEISMVRSDLLDCVDKFLRLNGKSSGQLFGGYQMVFIGDLYQLPPVVSQSEILAYQSPYFFHSEAFQKSNFKYIQLKTFYRQQDQVFLEILNAVRNNATEEKHLQILNQRALSEGQDKFSFEQFAVYLTTKNSRVREVNNFFLEKIPATLKTYTGKVSGSFEGRELPTDLELQLKVGSQVMMLNNDSKKRWVNGTMGKIVEADRDNELLVELENGEVVNVEPYTWENFKFVLDSKTQTVDSQTTGSFTQVPLKLAWAVTIHKAQGKTFSKVYIDLATGTFAHGQLYVALSRCKTLEGLHLKRPITASDIILDPRVVEFVKNLG